LVSLACLTQLLAARRKPHTAVPTRRSLEAARAHRCSCSSLARSRTPHAHTAAHAPHATRRSMDASPESKMEMETTPESEEVATDDVGQGSEEVAVDSVDMLLSVADSVEQLLSVAADSVDLLLDSMAADSVDPLQSMEAVDSIIAQDSVEMEMEMVPDSMESTMLSSEMEVVDSMAADSEVFVPESEKVITPASLPPEAFICGRCQLVHLNREAWDRVHTGKYPCSRCGLKHDDYLIFAVVRGIDNFECEMFIPDVNKIVFGVGFEQIVL